MNTLVMEKNKLFPSHKNGLPESDFVITNIKFLVKTGSTILAYPQLHKMDGHR